MQPHNWQLRDKVEKKKHNILNTNISELGGNSLFN